MDSNARSIAKAFSYRLLGSSVTALIMYLLTNRATLSLIGGGLDMVLKIAAYYVHERLWDHINFGRTKPQAPEYEI